MINIKDPTFIVGNAKKLDFIESNSIDLIITSPPYFDQDTKRYGGKEVDQLNFNVNEDEMLKELLECFYEMDRVLKNNGLIAINIGDSSTEDFAARMIPEKFIFSVINNTNYKLFSEIIVKQEYTFTYFPTRNYFKWYLLFKETPFLNNFYINKYRGRLWLLETEVPHSEIVNMSGEIFDNFSGSFAERIIRMYTKPGDIVLDPFGGIGTVAIAAYENNRNGISVDVSIDQKILAKNNFNIYKRELGVS